MDNTIAVIPKSVIIADSLLNVFLSTSDYSISGKEKEESGQAELRPRGTSRRVYVQYRADVRNPDQESV